jgi:4-alpha-glucanotransferase
VSQLTSTRETARRASTRRRRTSFRLDRRATGLLLHPTSLPGPHGCGDVGAEARAFADFCAAAKVRWWQMLPVNPPGSPPGNSPYSSTSAFAGSPWLINLDLLRDDGLLDRADVQRQPEVSARTTAQGVRSVCVARRVSRRAVRRVRRRTPKLARRLRALRRDQGRARQQAMVALAGAAAAPQT